MQQGAPARSPPEAREVTDGEGNRTEGVETDYKGVGLMLREVEGQQHVVRRIVPQSAAEKSGVIRVGDVLVAVDGRSVQSAPVDRLIPGPDGSAVNLTLRRAGAGGRRSMVEGLLLDTMFDRQTLEGVTEVVVDKDVVDGRKEPVQVLKGKEEAA